LRKSVHLFGCDFDRVVSASDSTAPVKDTRDLLNMAETSEDFPNTAFCLYDETAVVGTRGDTAIITDPARLADSRQLFDELARLVCLSKGRARVVWPVVTRRRARGSREPALTGVSVATDYRRRCGLLNIAGGGVLM
jgi:hypothetical protein